MSSGAIGQRLLTWAVSRSQIGSDGREEEEAGLIECGLLSAPGGHRYTMPYAVWVAAVYSVLERVGLLTEVGRCKAVKCSQSLAYWGAGGREQSDFMDESRCSHHLMGDEDGTQRCLVAASLGRRGGRRRACLPVDGSEA